MKRILFINNYDMAQSRQSYLDGNSPSHHQFGTSELIATGEYQVDYMLASPKGYKSRVLKLLSLFPVWWGIYRKALNYDIVYGGADFTVDFLGLMKKIGLFNPVLVAIFHHPPFPLRLKVERFDHILFLSSFALEEMKQLFPKKADAMTFMQWGPDLPFYQRYASVPNYQQKQPKITFISNGKTHRDHESLVTAAEKTGNHTLIVSDEWSLPANYNQACNYTEIFYQNRPDDTRMVKLLNSCSVLVVPTPATSQRLGPIGLTSLVDAIALGMPVITASNTVFTDIVEKHQMGIVYEAGNAEALGKAMNRFKEHPELVTTYGRNAFEFGQKNDMKKFGDKLYQLLKEQ